MQIGGFTIARTKALQLQALSARGGWWPAIREPFMGAWQRNNELGGSNSLSYYAVYACVRLITADVAKLGFRLVEENEPGIWTPTSSPSFSPVLRQPNHYQTFGQYVSQYIMSELLHGNAYVWKRRDNRNVVTSLYVLDPTRVTPLVAQDGSIYYELKRDDLSDLPQERIIVPASEIIHDPYFAPFHPLMGLTPLYAANLPVLQGLSIQNNSQAFFANGSNPGGMLSAPGAISDTTAARLLATVKAKNAGETLVAGDGLKFEKFTMTAVDSQLIEQLSLTAAQVCSAFGVPPYLVDVGPPPPYANFDPLLLKYHSQCIQSLTKKFEDAHDKGLGLLDKIDGRQLGTEFDVDDLIWMDTATRVNSAKTAVGAGLSYNEARKKYFGVGSIPGGDQVFAQQQMWTIEDLAARDIPAPPSAGSQAPVDTGSPDMPNPDMMDQAASYRPRFLKAVVEALDAPA